MTLQKLPPNPSGFTDFDWPDGDKFQMLAEQVADAGYKAFPSLRIDDLSQVRLFTTVFKLKSHDYPSTDANVRALFQWWVDELITRMKIDGIISLCLRTPHLDMFCGPTGDDYGALFGYDVAV